MAFTEIQTHDFVFTKPNALTPQMFTHDSNITTFSHNSTACSLSVRLKQCFFADDIGAAYVTLRRLILEYLGMNVSNTDESVKSGSGRQSAGSQGSRPGTGGRGYKLQNIDESNPKGSVVGIIPNTFLDYSSQFLADF